MIKKITAAALCSILIFLCGCEKKFHGNMESYTMKDGIYYARGQQFSYKKKLSGQTPAAVKNSSVVVLTNNPEIDFETVMKSLYSSSSADWLTDTIIIDLK